MSGIKNNQGMTSLSLEENCTFENLSIPSLPSNSLVLWGSCYATDITICHQNVLCDIPLSSLLLFNLTLLNPAIEYFLMCIPI